MNHDDFENMKVVDRRSATIRFVLLVWAWINLVLVVFTLGLIVASLGALAP